MKFTRKQFRALESGADSWDGSIANADMRVCRHLVHRGLMESTASGLKITVAGLAAIGRMRQGA
jgi:hypothetical protein